MDARKVGDMIAGQIGRRAPSSQGAGQVHEGADRRPAAEAALKGRPSDAIRFSEEVNVTLLRAKFRRAEGVAELR